MPLKTQESLAYGSHSIMKKMNQWDYEPVALIWKEQKLIILKVKFD
jgi:hypothetical protein